MKRDAYGDDGPMQKRQRQTDDEVTFLIPSKVRIITAAKHLTLLRAGQLIGQT